MISSMELGGRCLLATVLWCALATPVHAGDAEKGKNLYASRCMFCHGATGKGDGPAGAALKPSPTNFTSADYWQKTSPEAIKEAIANGKPGTAMVAFKGSLSPEQLDDIIAYLQTFKPQQ